MKDEKIPMVGNFPGETVLEKIADFPGARIFSIYRTAEGDFVLTEACDNHFSVQLNAEELRCLGEELIAWANGVLR